VLTANRKQRPAVPTVGFVSNSPMISPEVIYASLYFILGVFFGSFFHVIVDRLPKGESFVAGRSYCDNCRKTIKWYDLIPVISYVVLAGKCRYCHKHISMYYPLVEMLCGILFFLCALHASDTITLLYSLLVMSTLLIIFFCDLKYTIIPFVVVIFGTVFTLFYQIFFSPSIGTVLLSAFGAFVFFLIIFLVTKGRGMGFGDVIYVFYMGLLLSFPGIVFGLYLSFLTGAVVSLILVLTGKKRLRGDSIPFGPFLVFGTIVIFFYGKEIQQVVQHYIPLF
jgi:prepilin signal peptidase PulO-like enzyme (type II secretory pathway)